MMDRSAFIALLVAIIPALASIICQLIISNKNRRDTDIKDAQKEQRLTDRLEQIDKKLDEHNGYAKKIGQIERSLIRIDTIVSMSRRELNAKKHFKR